MVGNRLTKSGKVKWLFQNYVQARKIKKTTINCSADIAVWNKTI